MDMEKILLYLSGLIMLASCSVGLEQEPFVAGEVVDVSLSLSVEKEAAGTHAYNAQDTRAVNSESSAPEVKNLWVLQYSGTSDDAILINKPEYISDWTIEANRKIPLISTEEQTTIVFLANTFDSSLRFLQGSTLANLKARSKVISNQADLFGIDGNADSEKTFPNDGDYHFMLNGSVNAKIGGGVNSISCDLKRNITKIDFNINIAQGSGISITSVELCSVPACSYYFNSYVGEGEHFPSSNSFNTISYSPVSESAAENGLLYTFYASANQRGIVENKVGEMMKNRFAPNNSSFILVNAMYDEGNNVSSPVTYRFYLGADLTEDFNLRPNYNYTYNIDINSKGDASVDPRIEDWGTVDFRLVEDANCYILNPNPVAGTKRAFKIPVSRVDTFWGNSGYENVYNYTLGPSKGWNMYVVWADFDYDGLDDDPNDDSVKFTKSSGSGKADIFEVEVASGVKGNMLVGLKTDGSNYWLWTWHLWITDYKPDDWAYPGNVQPQTYVYPVAGGAIHRYAGSAWEKVEGTACPYEKSFAMDRNLGTWDAGYSPTGKGSLVYQFGRKDPLPVSYSSNLVGPNNPVVGIVSYDATETENNNNMQYSVFNPLTLIIGSYTGSFTDWTLNDIYNPAQGSEKLVWHDPTLTVPADYSLVKSLFDPCPPGWCVPPYIGFWGDFRYIHSDRPTTNAHQKSTQKDPTPEPWARNFPSFWANNGLNYWPYSSEDARTDIFFPSHGYVNSNGGVNSYGGYGSLWCGTASSNILGYGIRYYPTYMAAGAIERTAGHAVRCVKMNS